jgi:hypothetical protein
VAPIARPYLLQTAIKRSAYRICRSTRFAEDVHCGMILNKSAQVWDCVPGMIGTHSIVLERQADET